MLTIYLITSNVILGLLFLMWEKSNWFNFLVKTILFATFVLGVICTLGHFGYLSL